MEGPHLVAHQEFLPVFLLGVLRLPPGAWGPQVERRRKERRSDVSGNHGAQRTRIPSLRDFMRCVYMEEERQAAGLVLLMEPMLNWLGFMFK